MTWALLSLGLAVVLLVAESIRKDRPHAYQAPDCGERCCEHCMVCGRGKDYLQHQVAA